MINCSSFMCSMETIFIGLSQFTRAHVSKIRKTICNIISKQDLNVMFMRFAKNSVAFNCQLNLYDSHKLFIYKKVGFHFKTMLILTFGRFVLPSLAVIHKFVTIALVKCISWWTVCCIKRQ